MIQTVGPGLSALDGGADVPWGAGGSSEGWVPGVEVLPLMAQLSAVPCLVRDSSLSLRWCNDAYIRLEPKPQGELLGSKLEEVMPAKAANERAEMIRRVLETRRPAHYYQCARDQRLACTMLPIDSDSFGFEGVMVILQRATGLGDADESLPVLETPYLDLLGVLSPAELRVLHHLGKGQTTAEIGRELSRSAKTIEKQIESVHRKLGTGSRAELVKLAVERGLQAFGDDEWERVIDGSRVVKRSGS
ncbi:MAG: LuxR C-terminal-related transcriptional regulator [Planctomycetota bacterium]